MKEYTVLSLFDGHSCGMVALKDAGVGVGRYFASEIDGPAMEVSKKNHPEIEHIGDVVNVKGSNLPKIDILIGGSPCQGFSRDGKGLNFEDPRSRLFFEFVRLLEETAPQYFLLENVVMKKEWVQVITDHLGVEPIEINSSLVSAQKRPRLYWTNIPGVEQPEDRGVILWDILDHGQPSKPLTPSEASLVEVVGNEVRVREATKKGYKVAHVGDSVNFAIPTSTTRRGRVGRGKTNTLMTSPQFKVMIVPGEFRDLSIHELERLQNLPNDYTSGVSMAQRKKMIGNGWTVGVVSHIFSNIGKIVEEPQSVKIRKFLKI